MPMIYYHHDQLWAETLEDFLDHLDHDFDYRADDIWASSYPRSGTAWIYEVPCAILYVGDSAVLLQAQRKEKIRQFGALEVGTAASASERLNAWKSRPSSRVIPTHIPDWLYPKVVLERQWKRVYVVRNPKDVAASFYHFHRSHHILGSTKGHGASFSNVSSGAKLSMGAGLTIHWCGGQTSKRVQRTCWCSTTRT
jgi:Sulfotransferase domain